MRRGHRLKLVKLFAIMCIVTVWYYWSSWRLSQCFLDVIKPEKQHLMQHDLAAFHQFICQNCKLHKFWVYHWTILRDILKGTENMEWLKRKRGTFTNFHWHCFTGSPMLLAARVSSCHCVLALRISWKLTRELLPKYCHSCTLDSQIHQSWGGPSEMISE